MYKGILLSPVMAKLFEYTLLEIYEDQLSSDPLQFRFYPRGTSDARVLAVVLCLSVCMSVCVCHTPALYIKTAKYVESRKERHVIAQEL